MQVQPSLDQLERQFAIPQRPTSIGWPDMGTPITCPPPDFGNHPMVQIISGFGLQVPTFGDKWRDPLWTFDNNGYDVLPKDYKVIL